MHRLYANTLSRYLRGIGILGFAYGESWDQSPGNIEGQLSFHLIPSLKVRFQGNSNRDNECNPLVLQLGKLKPREKGFSSWSPNSRLSQGRSLGPRPPAQGPTHCTRHALDECSLPLLSHWGSQSQESAADTILPPLLFEQKAGGLSKEEAAKV